MLLKVALRRYNAAKKDRSQKRKKCFWDKEVPCFLVLYFTFFFRKIRKIRNLSILE